ncbi:TadE/TadG family type IV pilus assembly protein [Hyphococcus sp.]|jgi:hypothetical protein|uniref:TadE/TadG family type IV pilus assembly protein n=1 Tax=Hyphococcus sp. TaxID=2038636 RepID=UPI0035C76ADA
MTGKRFMKMLRCWVSDIRGLAAMETAFLAPILVLGGLVVFDLGLAGTQRLQLDQALRAGAQVSMINVTDENEILAATLAALGEAEAGSVMEDGICAPNASCINVSYACDCGGTASVCDQLCVSSGDIPSAYLTIVAQRRHEGLLLPDMGLETQITVQTR